MAADSEGAGLSSSLTDLMTSLAVIFILLLVASYNNEQQKIQDELGKTPITRNEILVALKRALKEFAAQGVETKNDPRDPLNLLVIVPAGLLEFAWGKAEIPLRGMRFLGDLTPRLAETVCDKEDVRKEISAIVIEGHTDSSGPEVNNLQLSQARAMAVAREVLNVLSAPTTAPSNPSKVRTCFLDFLSASGRGSSEPIKNETTDREDPERSRRVVFKIRVRSFEQRQEQETPDINTSPKAVETP